MSYILEIEELRQLQEIISRHEEQALKIRGWMYTILTILSAAYITKDNIISWYFFLSISIVVTVLFLCNELVHRSFVRLAINRSSTVQTILREKKEYDGPLISDSLAQKLVPKTMKSEFEYASVWVHYFSLWTILSLVSLAKLNG